MLKGAKVRTYFFVIFRPYTININHKIFCVITCKVVLNIDVWLPDYNDQAFYCAVCALEGNILSSGVLRALLVCCLVLDCLQCYWVGDKDPRSYMPWGQGFSELHALGSGITWISPVYLENADSVLGHH